MLKTSGNVHTSEAYGMKILILYSFITFSFHVWFRYL